MTDTALANPPKPAAIGTIVNPAPANAVRLADTDPMQMLSHDLIEPSPLNPRKSFDADKIAQLVESIAVQGVLQNLVVRPHPKKPGRYEICAGESRWRAVDALVKAGRLPRGYALPCRVKPIDDRTLLELALTENVQRNDLTPLEEAEAYKRLVAMGVGTDEIAKRVGCTRRHVQLRLALVDKLHPKAQKRLAEGTLNAEQCRELAKGPRERQASLLDQIINPSDLSDDRHYGDLLTAADIRDALREDMVPVAHAIFDRKLYKGEIVRDDESEEEFFAEPDQFTKLQKVAVEAKATELKKKWAFVKEFDYAPHDNALPYNWRKATKDEAAKGKAGALLILNDGKLTVHEGVVEKTPDRPTKTTRGSGVPQPAMTQAFVVHCHLVRSAALKAAVADDFTVALRCACLALLGAHGVVHIQAQVGSVQNAIAGRIAELRKPFATLMKRIAANSGDDLDEDAPDAIAPLGLGLEWGIEADEECDGYAILAKMERRELEKLFALLVAQCVNDFPGSHEEQVGASPPGAAIAADAGVDMAKAWTIDRAFLEGAKRAQLDRIIADLRLADTDVRLQKGTAKMTQAALRQVIIDNPAKLKGYTPPWARFATSEQIEAALEKGTAKKAPAKPKAKSKKKR